MHSEHLLTILRDNGYRDTQPRRMVIAALAHFRAPVSPYSIQQWIERKKDATISTVTVYRIMQLLESLHMVHRHPCSGKFTLCDHPDKRGRHAYLHCHQCGDSQEFISGALDSLTKRQAKKYGFTSAAPLFEIVGTCLACSRRS